MGLRFSDPIPDRGWLNWNGGRLFDPVLVGYQPVYSLSVVTSAISPQATGSAVGDGQTTDELLERRGAGPAGKTEIVAEEKEGKLPWGYFDLRYRGIGLVVDFGWKRTEEGMKWEGEMGQMPLDQQKTTTGKLPTKEIETEGSDGELEKSSGEVEVEEFDVGGWRIDGGDLKEDEVKQIEEMPEEHKVKVSGWKWPSFVGAL